MTWTKADEARLHLATGKSLAWLGRLSFRGHCLICDEQGRHEIACPLVAVMTKLENIRAEERRVRIKAASVRANIRAKIRTQQKPPPVLSQCPLAMKARRLRAKWKAMRRTA